MPEEAPKFKFKVKWEPRVCTVDLTPWVDMDPPCVVTLQEPDVAGTYRAGADITTFQARNPEWSDTLCAHVVSFAVSHVSPDVGASGLFYEALARDCPDAFNAVRSAFNDAFPAVNSMGEAIEAEKKD